MFLSVLSVIKEYRQKVGTLKRNQQTEKKKNAQLLEEARKREDTFTDDASQLSVSMLCPRSILVNLVVVSCESCAGFL